LSELVKKLVIIDKRYGFNPAVGHGWIYLLKTNAHFVPSIPKIEICRDKNDNMVLGTALAGEAEYIITGDKNLLDIKKYKKIKIVTAKDFLKEAAG
jgi:putative PIN family toxin of toxin-antitoxin system